MEKRVVIFLILSLAIILGYDYLLKQFGLAPQPSRPAQTGKPQAAPDPAVPAVQPDPVSSGKTVSAPTKPPATAESPKTASQGAATEQLETVETDLYRAVLTNRGAEIQSWELLRFTAQDRTKGIQLHPGGSFPGPLALHTSNPPDDKEVREGLYRVERDFGRLDAEHPAGHLTFTYAASGSGLRVTKRLTFHHDSYLVDVAVTTKGLAGPVNVGLGTNFGIVEWGEGFIGLIGPAMLIDDKLEKETPEGEVERKGAVRWVALQDKYFIGVLIPANATTAVVKKHGDKLFSSGVWFEQPASPDTPLTLQLYAGPKEYGTLKSLNVNLEDTIDFGWFIYGSWGIVKAVAKPLFTVMRFINTYTHNYGFTIVIVTILVKLLFVPLQYKSYKSMKDMQLIQPKVVALQSKYKDDRERLNRELIKLYRDHKVNPVGGCLPMLLQMPVFVALFNILYMTIDLRQAPFILWISDLSVQDPYYVLPVLMGVSMVVQQKIMPTTMDPTQAKVMLILPAFMTLLFLTFPSGLVLYWLTNNVLTIGQQFVTDRYIFKRPTFTTPPPESQDAASDGQKSSGKRKRDKAPDQEETDSRIET
jgi:YidC/Oxa1 family membrane protein insertase